MPIYMIHFYSFDTNVKPIFLGGGGGIYLECPLLLKISKIKAESRGHGVSKFKLGHMWPNKKGYGSKNFLEPGPGARKVGPPENLRISKFGFFDFAPKLEEQNQG